MASAVSYMDYVWLVLKLCGCINGNAQLLSPLFLMAVQTKMPLLQFTHLSIIPHK